MGADDTKDDGPAVIAPPWAQGLDAPPGTAWTRADGLRLGDVVSIGDDAEDRAAQVVAIERDDPLGRLRLGLAFELDGALIVRCSQAPAPGTRYLRQLPETWPAYGIPVTTIEGLASAWRIYDRAWDTDGTVVLGLPARVAGRLLRERGWRRLGATEEAEGWRAPTGERFSEIDDALRFALTAEYAEAAVRE